MVVWTISSCFASCSRTRCGVRVASCVTKLNAQEYDRLPIRHTRISDLHVWRIGKRSYSCALSLVTHDATLTPQRVREQLAKHEEIVHTTIEIQQCLPHPEKGLGGAFTVTPIAPAK